MILLYISFGFLSNCFYYHKPVARCDHSDVFGTFKNYLASSIETPIFATTLLAIGFYVFEYLQQYVKCKFASNLHAIFFANFLSVCVHRESSDTKNQLLVHFYQRGFFETFPIIFIVSTQIFPPKRMSAISVESCSYSLAPLPK